MSITERVKDLVQLGKVMAHLGEDKEWNGYDLGLTEQEYDDLNVVIQRHKHINGWFEPEQIRHAMLEWSRLLTTDILLEWIDSYPNIGVNQKNIGVIMAGNIPLVGFHDFLTILISGHRLIGKLSSDADKLLPALTKVLVGFNQEWEDKIVWKEGKLEGYDAIIATGSNNTSRYFEYYFKNVPSIIRKNRTGIAILTGEETKEELRLLGKDVFQYYGLGCRNVSKIYIPREFVLDRFFEAIYDFHAMGSHNKYANNYDYHRAIFLMNKEPFLENGFVSIREMNDVLTSPVGVIIYERYDDLAQLRRKLDERSDEIQCIISKRDIPFGQGQSPQLHDYADGVDTMAFVTSLA